MSQEFLYIDAFSGISGNMLVAALLDLDSDSLEWLTEELTRLDLDGWTLELERVRSGSIAARRFTVLVADSARHRRRYAEIEQLIAASSLAEPVRRQSLAVFERLAQAEAQAHGEPLEAVHFHELGMVDSIIDIVAACLLIERLAPQTVLASTLVTGSGLVDTEHGVMPVPAPATAILLQGLPVSAGAERQELITPTGAALAAHFVDSFEPLPAMTLGRVGYGAGTRPTESAPNLLRLITGSPLAAAGAGERERQVLIESNIDDGTPEQLAYLCERLLSAGAADAWLIPVIMKKGRPGVLLSVLCPPPEQERLLELIFRESSTFGVRLRTVERRCLAREFKQVETAFGPINVKVGYREGEAITASPEYEDCRRAALERGVPINEVYAAARDAIKSSS